MLDWKDPLPLQGVVDRSIALFEVVLPRAYPLAFVIALISDYAFERALDGHQGEIDALAKAGDFATIGERFGGRFFAFALLSLWLSNALLHFIGALARERPVAPFASLGVALRLYPQLLAATAIYFVALWAGLILFVVPGLFIAVAWSFYAQAVLFDGDDAWHGLVRSFRLTRGHWWRTLALFVLLVFAALCAAAVTGIALGLVVAVVKALGAASLAPSFRLLIGSALGAAVTIAIDALLIAWYHDLSVRGGVQTRDASLAA